MYNIICEKYYVNNLDNLKDTIMKYGIAIIPSILNDDECKEMENEMWNYLEYITKDWNDNFGLHNKPINRNDKTTWKFIDSLTNKNIIFQFWNIGHSQMCWNNRQNPKIVNVFAKFWNVEPTELHVSFDGASFQLCKNNNHKEWFHVDHSYNDSTFKNIQSWVTCFDVTSSDASLIILESSNLLHEEVSKKFNLNNDLRDYKHLLEEQLDYYLNRCIKQRIVCPKGSLVIWDSRTVHYADYSLINELKNLRCISYLCYKPKNQSSEENNKLRQRAFDNLYTTSHDPLNIKFKYNTPYINDQDVNNYITKINKPILTELGKSLII